MQLLTKCSIEFNKMMFNDSAINEFSMFYTVLTLCDMTCDDYDKLIEESYPDNLVITNSYDAYGYLTAMRGNGKTLFTYSAVGHILIHIYIVFASKI